MYFIGPFHCQIKTRHARHEAKVIDLANWANKKPPKRVNGLYEAFMASMSLFRMGARAGIKFPARGRGFLFVPVSGKKYQSKFRQAA